MATSWITKSLACFIPFITVLVSVTWYLGFFINIQVYELKFPKTTLYLKHTKADYLTEAEDSLKSLNNLLTEANLTKPGTGGIISLSYDDPFGVVNRDELRFSFGVIIEHSSQIAEYGKLLGPIGFRLETLPETLGMGAQFPYKMDISKHVGGFKIMGKLFKAVIEHPTFPNIQEDLKWPEMSLPLLQWRNYGGENLHYFLPMGDYYKSYILNKMEAPTYTPEYIKDIHEGMHKEDNIHDL